MSRKIRIGNDIDIKWSLIDQSGAPYIVEGRDVSIELEVMSSKRTVKIKDIETSGNMVHFIFYGKDQKYTGHYHVKFIENNKEVEMVTFDVEDVFQLVEHSWLAADEGQEPDRIEIESITIESQINSSVGPVGPAAGFGEVTAEINNSEEGEPSVVVTTSGQNTAKNFHFKFDNIQGPEGPEGPRGLTGAVLWPEIYVDSDLHLHIVEPYPALSERLYIQNGKLYLRN